MFSKLVETLRSVCRCRWLCWIQCCVSPRVDHFDDLQQSQRFLEKVMFKNSEENDSPTCSAEEKQSLIHHEQSSMPQAVLDN
jgi:hypothetical protein